MAVYGYGRASKAKQVSSPATQKQLIADYCKREGLDFKGHYFIDPSVSGKTNVFDRPAGSEMMRLLKRGDQVVVAHLDRLSRSFVNFAMIADTFETRGVILHVVDIPGGKMDPSNHVGSLLMAIVVAFGEYERRMNSVRTAEGLAAVKSEGALAGGPAPYGTKMVRRWNVRLQRELTFLEPCVEEQRWMRKMVALRASGMTHEQIALHFHKLKVPTRSGKDWSKHAIQLCLRRALVFMAGDEKHAGTVKAVEEAVPEDIVYADEISEVAYDDYEGDYEENLEEMEDE